MSAPCRVALLTAVDLWLDGAGHRARIHALCEALSRHTQLTLLLPLAPTAEVRRLLAERLPRVQVCSLDLPASGSRAQALGALQAFFAAQPQQACIVEYLSLGWMRRAIPPDVLTLVDTHDVVSQRDAELATLAPLDRPVLRPEQEAAQLRVFDRVIAISAADAAVFAGWVGPGRVLLVPHLQTLRPLSLRAQARRALFVGSAYAPNLDGLRWLLQNVWPALADTGLQLDVVGDVGPRLGLGLGLADAPGLRVHGRVADLEAAYAAADIVVNPVRHGSGMKIKTVEALAHGLPLVSTGHGVRGLAHVPDDPAFVVADDAAAFALALRHLATDSAARQRLGRRALQLAEDCFAEGPALRPLLAALGQAA